MISCGISFASKNNVSNGEIHLLAILIPPKICIILYNSFCVWILWNYCQQMVSFMKVSISYGLFFLHERSPIKSLKVTTLVECMATFISSFEYGKRDGSGCHISRLDAINNMKQHQSKSFHNVHNLLEL